MANNYTITSSVTSEYVGDSVVNGSIPSSVALIITPDTGYVVDAGDFYIGTALPPEVVSVSFANTGTALDPANTIIATVTLASWYTMPSNADTINVDIDGRTYGFKPRLSFTSVTTVDADFDVEFDAFLGGNITSATVDSIKTDTFLGSIAENKNTLVATMSISLTDSAKHITGQPSYRLSSSDNSKWSSTISSTTYNSDNQLTAIVYSFYYNMGSSNIDASLGESIIWSIPPAAASRTSTVNVSSAYYTGYKNESILPASNTDLQLNVVGNEGASYFVKVEDKNGLTYDFTSNTFTRELTSSSEQFIYHPSRQKLLGNNSNSNPHTISLPAYFKETAYDFYFTTTVTPSASTYTDVAGTSTDPHVITLRQFGEVDYNLIVTAGTYGTTIASTAIKSITNKTPLSTLANFIPADFPRISTYNNGYFSTSQTLGYTITNTTASVASGTTALITMTTSLETLKLEVGDTVSGTNIVAGSKITNLNSAARRITMDTNIAGTVASGATLTFTRTVGISRQPLVTDIANLLPLGVSFSPFYYDFSVIEAVTNSTLVKVEATGVSDIVVGMLVEGDNIIGYPTVVSQSNGIVILSQAQTIPLGENLTFSAAGRSLDISKLEVTGAGTADCKLIMEGSVLRMGNNNATDTLLLSNFITTYAAPTIVAATATCPLNSSITIEPLSGCTGHTGNLTIATVPSKGAGAAVISGDGKSILYVAPTSGTTDTITYTINDGVSATTGTADIVITLTP